MTPQLHKRTDTKKKYVIFAIISASMVASMVVFTYGSARGDEEAGLRSGQVMVEPAEVSYGDIFQAGGKVSATVVVSNVGESPLELDRISTSCGCTTADMDMTDMPPGESRDMTITFDPSVHPDQFGRIVRVVYLQTSDPDSPETEIDVTGNVIKDE